MLTSLNNEIDEVISMSYGADDYITKPYYPNILLLRIEALFRRVDYQPECLIYDQIKVYVDKGVLEYTGGEVVLTKNEMIIFNYLLTHRSKVVSRDDLMMVLWNQSEYMNDNALNVSINRLRNKLSEIGYENVIETRKGQGYILI